MEKKIKTNSCVKNIFNTINFKMPNKMKLTPTICSMRQKKKNNEMSSIPLKTIKYNISIEESIANVKLEQTYFNESNVPIETEFLFAISDDICFDSFEAHFDDKIVEGIIKEKEEAKKEYESEKKKGNVVAYSELKSEEKDLMKINLGNIPAKTEIKIKFNYIESLNVCMNKFWRIIIPSSFTPRNNSGNETINSLNNIPNKISEYTWEIQVNFFFTLIKNNNIFFIKKVEINSRSELEFIKCPSHEIKTAFSENKKKCEIKLSNEKNIPNKDFELLFRNNEINKPQVTLGHSKHAKHPYCAMLTFFPDFNEEANLDDAYNAYLKDSSLSTNFDVDFEKTNAEFIFVLDRSGSMSGHRIEMAKEALILFLKSLPPNSYFNVVSFGSDYSKMFKESAPANQLEIKNAIDEIAKYKGNLGGTEILDPIANINQMQLKKNFPRNVFLLTDGVVDNVSKVCQEIRNNSKNARVYTIGIGNGCSRELIVEGAECGKGKSEFIMDNEDMNSKIISLLSDSLTPFITDFSFEYDTNVVEMISPNPNNFTFLRKNESFQLFFFFNKSIKNESLVLLNCFDNNTDKKFEFILPINLNEAIKTEMIHKLGYFKMMKTTVNDFRYNRSLTCDDIYFAEKINIQEFCLETAIENQILTEFTAFICKIKEIKKNNEYHYSHKVIIPSIESVDYNQTQNLNNQSSPKPIMMKSSMPIKKTAQKAQIKMSSPMKSNGLKLKKDLPKPKHDVFLQEDMSQDYFNNEKTTIDEKKIIKSMDILKMQDSNGFWIYSEDLREFLKFSKKEEIINNLPVKIKDLVNSLDIMVTILVLQWLNKNDSQNQSSWKLIFKKAVSWLKKQGIVFKEYEDFKIII